MLLSREGRAHELLELIRTDKAAAELQKREVRGCDSALSSAYAHVTICTNIPLHSMLAFRSVSDRDLSTNGFICVWYRCFRPSWHDAASSSAGERNSVHACSRSCGQAYCAGAYPWHIRRRQLPLLLLRVPAHWQLWGLRLCSGGVPLWPLATVHTHQHTPSL